MPCTPFDVTLLRLARVVTPNIPEAEVLADMTIDSVDDMREAGRRILRLGCTAVIVKGGHLAGDESTDVLVDARGETTADGAARRPVRTRTAPAARSRPPSPRGLRSATHSTKRRARAKDYVTGAMRHGIDVGGGHQPLGHFWQTR